MIKLGDSTRQNFHNVFSKHHKLEKNLLSMRTKRTKLNGETFSKLFLLRLAYLHTFFDFRFLCISVSLCIFLGPAEDHQDCQHGRPAAIRTKIKAVLHRDFE